MVHPKSGWLVTNPSNSPENAHHRDFSICAGPTLDMCILRDLFDNVAKAQSVLQMDSDFGRDVLSARNKLAPLQIGARGQLQEWLDDWDSIAPEQQHRHISHLYALHPSSQICPESTPELAAAAKQTLENRGDESTGWATAWRILFWARLWDGEHAHKILRYLLTPTLTAHNMFDLHPPFQIDGNFGGAAAVLEMLVQSHEKSAEGKRLVRLLPALPSAWPDGSVSGILAKGGFVVGLSWKNGKLVHSEVVSKFGEPASIVYRDKVVDFSKEIGSKTVTSWE